MGDVYRIDLASSADDGVVDVTIGEASRRLDLLEVYCRLVDIHRAAKDAGKSTAAVYQELVALVEEFGFGKVSWRAAGRFQAGIFARMDAVAAKDAPAKDAAPAGADPVLAVLPGPQPAA